MYANINLLSLIYTVTGMSMFDLKFSFKKNRERKHDFFNSLCESMQTWYLEIMFNFIAIVNVLIIFKKQLFKIS